MPAFNPNAEEHIKQIRAEKFGLSVQSANASVNPLADDLQSAVQLLSEGLYTKELHFILELIQNAEDNDYEDNVRPDLTFMLLEHDPISTQSAEGALLVINNEIGFCPKNIDALCAVGKSTKADRQRGYIGEKGIGFKSVFLVSAEPHIISGGYQFRFQEAPDPQCRLGYIVPNWLPATPETISRYCIGKTCIVLPLKQGKHADIETQIESIAPETILFLSKLQGLTLQVDTQRSVEILKDDQKAPFVSFMVGDVYSEFWLVTEDYRVPKAISEEKRIGIEVRTVSVAFPLGKEPEPGRVFAFLPTLEVSGLPFLINADFILSSSREHILFDRPWNSWLRDCIAPTFVKAFEMQLEHVDFRESAYRFIPLTQQTVADFRPVVESVHVLLKDRRVIMVENRTHLVKPSEARLIPRGFRGLLADSVLPQNLPPVVSQRIELYHEQLRAIGVKSISSAEIIACLEDADWVITHDSDWVMRLYEYLSAQKWISQHDLGKARIVLLESGDWVCPGSQRIYFPPDNEAQHNLLARFSESGISASFVKDSIAQYLTSDRVRCDWARECLGIGIIDPLTFVQALASEFSNCFNDLETADIVLWTTAIRDALADISDETQEAKTRIAGSIPILLADGRVVTPRKWSDSAPLVTPESLDPVTGWQFVFTEPQERGHMTILSDHYLEKCSVEDIRRWRAFFLLMGATEAPYPKECKVDPWRNLGDFDKNLLAKCRSVLAQKLDSEYRCRRSNPSSIKCSYYLPPLWLLDLSRSSSVNEDVRIIERVKALVKLLSSWLSLPSWKTEPIFNAHCSGVYYTIHNVSIPLLGKILKEADWFPSSHGSKRPDMVFIKSQELWELFGDTIPYALESPSPQVVEWLGVRETATVSKVLDYLKGLASQDTVDPRVIAKIYAFLNERWRDSLKTEFDQDALIYVSAPKPRWISIEQAVWPDLSEVFGDTYVYLEPEYGPLLKQFFVDKLEIPARIEPGLYAQAWIRLSKATNLPTTKIIKALQSIYPEMLKTANEDPDTDWWQQFRSEALLWTLNQRFVSPTKVYLPDDGDLQGLFAQQGVEFVWIPSRSTHSSYNPLFRHLGVKALTEVVETTACTPVSMTDGTTEAPMLTVATKMALCNYLWNQYEEWYRLLKERGEIETLLLTLEYEVEELTVTHRLGELILDMPDSLAYWDKERRMLFRVRSCTPDRLEIEMAPLLACLVASKHTRDFEDFIGRILGAPEHKVEALARKRNWRLPQEERDWILQKLATLESRSVSSMDITDIDSQKQEELSRSTEVCPSQGEIESPLVGVHIGETTSAKSDTTDQERQREQLDNHESQYFGIEPLVENEEPFTTQPRRVPGWTSRPSHPGRHTANDNSASANEFQEPPGSPLSDSESTSPTTRASRTFTGKGSPRTRKRGRHNPILMLSRVFHKMQDDQPDPIGSEQARQERIQVERAGIEHVMRYEEARGRVPEEMPPLNPGYDIRSVDRSGEQRFIEVKALSGRWEGSNPAQLTRYEYEKAREKEDEYWLYVVEFATSDAARIYPIQNPAGMIQRYLFDHGWIGLAKEEDPEEDTNA